MNTVFDIKTVTHMRACKTYNDEEIFIIIVFRLAASIATKQILLYPLYGAIICNEDKYMIFDEIKPTTTQLSKNIDILIALKKFDIYSRDFIYYIESISVDLVSNCVSLEYLVDEDYEILNLEASGYNSDPLVI